MSTVQIKIVWIVTLNDEQYISMCSEFLLIILLKHPDHQYIVCIYCELYTVIMAQNGVYVIVFI